MIRNEGKVLALAPCIELRIEELIATFLCIRVVSSQGLNSESALVRFSYLRVQREPQASDGLFGRVSRSLKVVELVSIYRGLPAFGGIKFVYARSGKIGSKCEGLSEVTYRLDEFGQRRDIHTILTPRHDFVGRQNPTAASTLWKASPT